MLGHLEAEQWTAVDTGQRAAGTASGRLEDDSSYGGRSTPRRGSRHKTQNNGPGPAEQQAKLDTGWSGLWTLEPGRERSR